MPNPYDVGSARLMAALGAPALATSSAAHAFALGRSDMGRVSRDEALQHATEIVAATSLPVNGDLENGYGHSPDDVAETVLLAAEAGLSGCSIEDSRIPIAADAQPEQFSYSFELALDRVRAGVEAARSLEDPFIFTARADGVLIGSYDMAEALARVKAFEEAGADVVYVPIPPSLDDLEAVCKAVSCPVNALAAGPFTNHTKSEFAARGVRRISLGSSIARATHRVVHDVVKAMLDDGDFTPLQRSISGDDVDRLLAKGKPQS